MASKRGIAKYDGWAPSSVELELANRDGLLPMVGLDFHTARQFFPLTMIGEISAPVEDAVVVDALRAGQLAPTAFAKRQESFGQGAGLEAARAAEVLRRSLARTKRKLASVVGA